MSALGISESDIFCPLGGKKDNRRPPGMMTETPEAAGGACADWIVLSVPRRGLG